MLHAILNKSRKQHFKKRQLYGHLPSIQARYARHCWRSKDELISKILLWTPTHGHTSIGCSARTYQHQLCADIGCSLEDLPGAIDNKDGEKEETPCCQHNLMIKKRDCFDQGGSSSDFQTRNLRNNGNTCSFEISNSGCILLGFFSTDPVLHHPPWSPIFIENLPTYTNLRRLSQGYNDKYIHVMRGIFNPD